LSPSEIKRILVVDDDQIITDTLAAILRKSGYDVNAHYDGYSALRMLDGWVPDLLISDVVMPELNGVDLAIQVQQLYPGCKILLCSAVINSRELVEQARLQGYEFEFILKPIHPRDLLLKIAAKITA
jgi:CheY-like chemotaxis protein